MTKETIEKGNPPTLVTEAAPADADDDGDLSEQSA